MSAPARALLDVSHGGPLHPLTKAAFDAVGDAGWSDPAAVTSEGRRASHLRATALESLAASLAPSVSGTTAHVFPGGGQALAAALLGLLRNSRPLIVSAIDHSAALRVARWWESHGNPVVVVPVDHQGHLNIEAALPALDALGHGANAVASLQLANGEVGTRQNIEPLLTILTAYATDVVVDATACAGRIPLPTGWSVLVADAVSWGGPRGVGIVVTAPTGRWREAEPAIGTELPVALTVAAAAVLERAIAERDDTADVAYRQIARIRDALSQIADIDVAGDSTQRLPHILTASALYCHGESLARALDAQGVSVGSGSACANDSGEPSHVLAAMGVLTGGNIRLCLPLNCPNEHIDRFLNALPAALAQVREDVGMSTSDLSRPTESSEPDAWLDERGNRCPAPVIALARAAFTRDPGTIVAVMASDPAAATDIPAWCRMRGTEFLGERDPRDGGEGRAYLVRL